jgi:hypothetical protein
MKIVPQKADYFCPIEQRPYEVEVYTLLDLAEFLHKHPTGDEKFVVNIGASDGVTSDPCYPLFSAGWPGLAIEGSDNQDLALNLPQPDIIKMTGQFCTPMNIAGLLASAETPRQFSVLKVDIDGYDGPVLQSILRAGYRPAILHLEVNQDVPFPIEFSVTYSPDYVPVYTTPDGTAASVTGFHGMSFAYAVKLARHYGYHVISSSMFHLVDAIFLRDDLAPLFGSEIRMGYDDLLKFYLKHPSKPPNQSHFAIDGPFVAYNWRARTDYHALMPEVFQILATHSGVKHRGRILPFHFGIHPEAGA